MRRVCEWTTKYSIVSKRLLSSSASSHLCTRYKLHGSRRCGETLLCDIGVESPRRYKSRLMCGLKSALTKKNHLLARGGPPYPCPPPPPRPRRAQHRPWCNGGRNAGWCVPAAAAAPPRGTFAISCNARSCRGGCWRCQTGCRREQQ